MFNWVLVVLVAVGLVVLFKTTGVRFGKAWTFFIAGLIIFFLVTFGFVITRPGVDVASVGGFTDSIGVYFDFLSNLANNADTITGNVVNTNWTAGAAEGK